MAGGADRTIDCPRHSFYGGNSTVNTLDHDVHSQAVTADWIEMATVWLGGAHLTAEFVTIISL